MAGRTLSLSPFTSSSLSSSKSVNNNNYLLNPISCTQFPSLVFHTHRKRTTSSSLHSQISTTTGRPSSTTRIYSMLPTAKHPPPADTVQKWSVQAVKAYSLAQVQSHKLRFAENGTETLLMGILVEGTNEAAKFLRANGITLFKVRDEILKLVEKVYFPPTRKFEPPLTDSAQRALDWAVDEQMKSGDSEVTTTHLLLGIWSEEDSLGHKVLANLGFDNEKASQLRKSAS